MANVTVTTSNPSITVNQNNNTVNVSTVTSNVVIGASVNGTLANTIATSGRFGTLSVGNASTVQYTFPTTDGTANQILKTDGNGVLTFVVDDGAVDSVNGQTGTVVLTTSNINEGSNEYFTTARADARVNALLPNTDSLSEGSSNLYFTNARSRASISATSPALYDNSTGVISISSSALFTGKTTDDLTEGSSNLYYTTARQNTDFDTRLATKNTANLTEGTNLYYTDARVDSRLSSGSVTSNISTSGHVITNHLTPKTGNTITVAGNMEVSGNLNVVEKVDLLLQDNKIVLNYGNATARDAFITVDRSGSGLANANISWNETADKFATTNSLDVTGTLTGTTITDGTGSITGGVATAFSSITSTALVGNLTGDSAGTHTGAVTGAVTGDVTGNLTGDVTGNLTGNSAGTHTGAVTGAVTGDVTGNLTGDVTGNLTGNSAGTHTGAVTGAVTGNLTGDVTGNLTGNSAGTHTGNVITTLVSSTATTTPVKIKGDGIGGIQTNLIGQADVWRTGAATNEQYWGQIEFAGHAPRANNDGNQTYSGTTNIPNGYAFNQTTTAGNATVVINGVQRQAGFNGNGGFAYSTTASVIEAAINDINVGDVIHSGYEAIGTYGDSGFDADGVVLKVASKNATAKTITLNATASRSVNNSGKTQINNPPDYTVLETAPGFYDDSRLLGFSVANGEDAGGSGTNTYGYLGILKKDSFGMTQYARPTDFTASPNLAVGEFGVVDNANPFFLTNSKVTLADPNGITGDVPGPTLNAPYNMTIGKNTNIGNRPFADSFKSFGMNIGYNGKLDTNYFSTLPVTQLNITQHTKNSGMVNNNYFRDAAGPRVFLSSIDGDFETALGEQYAKNGDELGRVMAWSRSQTISGPSTYYANQKLSFYADDFTGSKTEGIVTLLTTDSTSRSSKMGTNNGDGISYNGGNFTYLAGDTVELKPVSPNTGNGSYSTGLGQRKKSYASALTQSTDITKGSRLVVGHGAESRKTEIGDLELGIRRNKDLNRDWVFRLDRGNFTTNTGGTANNGNFFARFAAGQAGDAPRFNATSKHNKIPEDWANGMSVVLSGFSGSFGTAVNGNTYYGKVLFNVLLELYTDAGLTTGLNTGVAHNTNIDENGTATITIPKANFQAADVVNQEYYWKLAEGESKLKLTDRRFGTNIEVLEYDPVDLASATAGKFVFNRPIETANVITSTGGFVGSLTGAPSSLSGLTTDGLTEGSTNLYHTNARSRSAVSVTTGSTSGGGQLAFNSGTGVFTFNPADTVDNATNATNTAISDNTTENATKYVSFVGGTSGNQPQEVSSSKLTFNPSTGTLTTADLTLKAFQETVVALGNQSGDISSSLNVDNGTIYSVTATGGITINSLGNAVAGTSFTLIITQDGTGSRTLTAGSNIKWAGGLKTLSTAGNAIDVISFFYDGTTYFASLGRGFV